MSIADLPTPRPVLDFPENRRHLLFLLGRVGQAMDVSPKMARTCWRDLGHHAHGLLVGACDGTARTPPGGWRSRPAWTLGSRAGTSVGHWPTSPTVSQTSCPSIRSDPTGSPKSPSPPTRSQET